jgi:hypothetical protein
VRSMGLFAEAGVAIGGSKFKAVNNRDKNLTRAKMQRRMAQIEESVARYLHQLDSADRQEPSLARTTKSMRIKEKIAKLKEEMRRLEALANHPGIRETMSTARDLPPRRSASSRPPPENRVRIISCGAFSHSLDPFRTFGPAYDSRASCIFPPSRKARAFPRW